MLSLTNLLCKLITARDSYPGVSKLKYMSIDNYFMGKMVYNKKFKKHYILRVFEMPRGSVGGTYRYLLHYW
jgi:hypothetical protein